MKKLNEKRVRDGKVKTGRAVAGFDPNRHGTPRNTKRHVLAPGTYQPETPVRSFVGRKRQKSSTTLTPPPPRSAHTLSPYPSTPRASTSISGQQQQSPEGLNDLQRRWHAVYCYTALKGSGLTEAEAAKQAALQFSCSESTIRSWKKRVDDEGDLSRKQYSTDRGRDLDVVSEAIDAVIQRVRAPIAQRTLLTLANSLLVAEGEDTVSLQTMRIVHNVVETVLHARILVAGRTKGHSQWI
eukprot:CAMPEP_0170748278 /NCGR_PEP_ID=MMETSP0437-20130122/9767_1 /TAXON_ID=0 /ORGANISM="Sexangularia sp." /LENGTH=239 /DNA_ID=CAMNT_0011087105 /DNA_START=119 /DNA_END=838 /DNA_ORIENTATION=-